MESGAVWRHRRGWLLYRTTIGYRWYKLKFFVAKQLNIAGVSMGDRFVDLMGRRGSLQVIMFVVALVVMIPHSRLYTRDSQTIVGRDTMLYTLIGPGSLDLELEEITPELISGPNYDTPAWREGMLMPMEPNAEAPLPREIAGITSGVTPRPTIISGVRSPFTPEASGAASRRSAAPVTFQRRRALA